MIRVRSIDRWLGAVVVLAMLSLILSMSILFINFGPDLVTRANISLAISTSLALVLGTIAIIVTIGMGGSEYKARETLKKDLTTLSITLALMFEKSAIILAERGESKDSGRSVNLDKSFRHEKVVIQKILTSTTGFALYSWAQDKSEEAQGKPEIWRTFTMGLQYIATTTDDALPTFLYQHKQQNETIVSLLEQLSEREIGVMSAKILDLDKALELFKTANQANAIMKVYRGKA